MAVILWRHQMGAVSALLSLCVGNLPVTGGFPSQMDSNADFDVSLCQSEQTVKQALD